MHFWSVTVYVHEVFCSFLIWMAVIFIFTRASSLFIFFMWKGCNYVSFISFSSVAYSCTCISSLWLVAAVHLVIVGFICHCGCGCILHRVSVQCACRHVNSMALQSLSCICRHSDIVTVLCFLLLISLILILLVWSVLISEQCGYLNSAVVFGYLFFNILFSKADKLRIFTAGIKAQLL